MADTPVTETNPAATAKALLDSGEGLLLNERLMVRQVREYAAKSGISAENAQLYINFLNGSGGSPEWLGQAGADNALHANSREIYAINLLKNDRDAQLSAFRAAATANGVNADAGIAEMRRALTGADPKADETAIALFNAMGQKDGKPLSNYLTDLVYPQHGTAYFSGIDKLESLKRKGEEVWNAAWSKAGEWFGAAKAGADAVVSTVSDGAQTAGAQGESWMDKIGGFFGGLWEKGKDNFGGVAGGMGVGALFYLIANGLGGNSWFGKIVGVMAGLFGAVLGFNAFGKGDGNAPSTVVSGRGLNYNGAVEAAPDQALLRGQNRAPAQSFDPNDLNRDGILSDAELNAQIAKVRNSVRENNSVISQNGGSHQDFDPAALLRGRQPAGSRARN